jgi:glycosyltransferase involved in cell wall biosynthesis
LPRGGSGRAAADRIAARDAAAHVRTLTVATFAWPDHYGGAERVIGEVCARLAARGHAVRLLTADTGGLPAREDREGVSVRRYPVERGSPARFYRSVFRGVRAALREEAAFRAELMHVHQPLSGVAAIAPGVARPEAVLTSFYAPYHQEYLARFRDGRPDGAVPASAHAVSALLRHGDRYLLRRSREVLVLSAFSRAQVAALCPEALALTTVAPAGVDVERFRPARDEAERRSCAGRFGLSADAGPVVLSVRRLVPRMGLADLMEACRLAASAAPLQLAIAGEGPLREDLERRAQAAGLGGRLRLLGRVPDAELPALYRAASVFALPTRALEGFGMATAEALASGLPVLATRAGASAELLEGIDGARLCAPEDPRGLADALLPLLTTPELAARAGAAARRYAVTRLTWDRHVDAVEAAARRALVPR